MHSKGYDAWLRTGMAAWALGAEASLVASLRLARIATGGSAAADEARLMVTEKIVAATELQAELAHAAVGMTPLTATTRTLSHYRRKVAANRRRLLRKT